MNLRKHKELVYSIIGAAMEVHRELGGGLLEPIYNEALFIELQERGIHCEREKQLPCFYKEYKLTKYYQMDLVVEDVIVELKSVNELIPAHREQLFNYLRLTRMPIGLLINFGLSSLQGERYAYLDDDNECVLIDKNMDIVY
ncbi:MAG: GxxExxY protein [Bacteroidales bacterium]|nr:GxxExxY protein [Bacteroidales bacterium]